MYSVFPLDFKIPRAVLPHINFLSKQTPSIPTKMENSGLHLSLNSLNFIPLTARPQYKQFLCVNRHFIIKSY